MKVFISWSGKRSKRIGEIFRDYLKFIIQSCDPFFSPEIDKGARWFSEISKELEDSDAGIICLTKENINEPWILFEAGALSKSLEQSRVCVFLMDLEPTDLTDPLAQFQATKNSKEDIFKLFTTINSHQEKSLDITVLSTIFETFWPKFEDEMKSIPATTKKEELPVRNDRELLEDILNMTRNIERRQSMIESRNTSQKEFYDYKNEQVFRKIFNFLSHSPGSEKWTATQISKEIDEPWIIVRYQLDLMEDKGMLEGHVTDWKKFYKINPKSPLRFTTQIN